MLSRLMIHLSDQELEALQRAAEKEMRGIREQARFVIRKQLKADGLLLPLDTNARADQAEVRVVAR